MATRGARGGEISGIPSTPTEQSQGEMPRSSGQGGGGGRRAGWVGKVRRGPGSWVLSGGKGSVAIFAPGARQGCVLTVCQGFPHQICSLDKSKGISENLPQQPQPCKHYKVAEYAAGNAAISITIKSETGLKCCFPKLTLQSQIS